MFLLRLTTLSLALSLSAIAGENLPQSVTFKGHAKFDALVARALSENWQALPMGGRVAKFGLAMRGTKYEGFTLEIDDHVESPSANFSAGRLGQASLPTKFVSVMPANGL